MSAPPNASELEDRALGADTTALLGDRGGSWRARVYLSGHHVGVIEEHATYLERLSRYQEKIASRERRLLDFLADPRSLDEMAAHRFVHRPHDVTSGVERTERATALRRLARLERAGRVRRRGDRWMAG
ncbi:MAG TPA: hypothetical protein VMV46_06655 [Thermoanaerobaculia bacterium]|nr:hypothetical protein [Thermoanaerobaculia bacterium]